jgi:hypothetical protein
MHQVASLSWSLYHAVADPNVTQAAVHSGSCPLLGTKRNSMLEGCDLSCSPSASAPALRCSVPACRRARAAQARLLPRRTAGRARLGAYPNPIPYPARRARAGARPAWLLGNLAEVAALGGAATAHAVYGRRYGPVWTSYGGPAPLVVTDHPEHARRVLQARAACAGRRGAAGGQAAPGSPVGLWGGACSAAPHAHQDAQCSLRRLGSGESAWPGCEAVTAMRREPSKDGTPVMCPAASHRRSAHTPNPQCGR